MSCRFYVALRRSGSWLALALWVSALIGCGDSPVPEGLRSSIAERTAVDTGMPKVVRIDRFVDGDYYPPSVDVDHSVSAEGRTLYFRPPIGEQSAGIILDSLGVLVSRFGRFGEGPEEYRFPVRMFFSDTGTSLIFDAGLQRLTTIDLTGKFLESRPIRSSGLPIAVVGDSLDFAYVAGERFSVARHSTDNGSERRIISEATREIILETGWSKVSPRGRPVVPVFGSNGREIVIGHPWTYTLLIFSAQGTLNSRIHRDLEPVYRTERQINSVASSAGRWRGPNGEQLDRDGAKAQARAEVMPYFSHVSPLGFDYGRRLWIVGSEGDSAYADVFANSRFLARLSLPCYDFAGRWSINGHWLSLSCGANSLADTSGSPTLQLYRID